MSGNRTNAQQLTFDSNYAASDPEKWGFHDSADLLTRFLRDRRINMALEHIRQRLGYAPLDWKALVVCGGVGGEGTLLANSGFTDVTVSDFSASALRICEERDPRLHTRFMNAEVMEAPDNSYDLALVQDGLHHLPRPVLGFTEMLRVARKAVVVIEPHAGVVSNLFGTRWERHGAATNYVFRWNHALLEQVTRSYLLEMPCYVKGIRTWDHNRMMRKLTKWVGGHGRGGLFIGEAAYAMLNTLLPTLGNMMIGVVIKEHS